MNATTKPLAWRHTTIALDDSEQLAVQTTGQGPPLLFANGIGVVQSGVEPLVRHLAQRFEVICWDYRGMGRNRLRGSASLLSVERHAQDVVNLMDGMDIERAPLVGWSMGVPVGLEVIRRVGARITAFAALFGSPGLPFHTSFPGPVGMGLRTLFGLLHRFPKIGQAGLELATTAPGLALKVLTQISFVGDDLDRDAFLTQLAGVRRTPKGPYYGTMLEIARHSASDMLPRIACPTLVVAGGRDWLTPPAVARRMADAVPGSRYVLFQRASHFGVIEQADAIAAAILDLLSDL